jgi:hypothetical protein
MILDQNLIVSGTVGGTAVAPVITGQGPITATAVSTNTIDLTTARDIFEGNDLVKLRALTTVAFNNLTSLTIEIIVASDAALTTNIKVVGSSGAIPLASLTIGQLFAIEGNAQIGSLNQRYLGARYTVTGTAPSTGSILADFGMEVQDGKKFYASGFAVL